ncbi:cytochrome oxidase putative small subunit CydP [uncultured Abyssibacter sp.]|uniref:cytochrome oxidase putative small subunit CydP n=1 Tax=uncultured Abyssibacter sp. TaxID=2320202 RepID=UPI0032B2CE9B
MTDRAASAPDWPRHLRWGIAITLVVKLMVLITLKTLFFSGEHRVEVTPTRVDAQLFPAQSRAEPDSRSEELADD